MLQALSHICSVFLILSLCYGQSTSKHFRIVSRSFSFRTTSYGSRIIRLLFSLPLVRIAGCKGSNLITLGCPTIRPLLNLFLYHMLPKLCQKLLGMGIYHSLPNPVIFNLDPYRKTLSSLYDLVELPNYFWSIARGRFSGYRVSYW